MHSFTDPFYLIFILCKKQLKKDDSEFELTNKNFSQLKISNYKILGFAGLFLVEELWWLMRFILPQSWIGGKQLFF